MVIRGGYIDKSQKCIKNGILKLHKRVDIKCCSLNYVDDFSSEILQIFIIVKLPYNSKHQIVRPSIRPLAKLLFKIDD